LPLALTDSECLPAAGQYQWPNLGIARVLTKALDVSGLVRCKYETYGTAGIMTMILNFLFSLAAEMILWARAKPGYKLELRSE